MNMGNRILIARTCLKCGFLLGRKHFRKTRKLYWSSTCYSCISKISRARYPESVRKTSSRIQTEHQNRSLESATKYRQGWTLKELDEIVEAIHTGLTYNEIAIRVNRSYYSITHVVHRYDLRDNWPTREKWIIKLSTSNRK